jgi:hypothetical protein
MITAFSLPVGQEGPREGFSEGEVRVWPLVEVCAHSSGSSHRVSVPRSSGVAIREIVIGQVEVGVTRKC